MSLLDTGLIDKNDKLLFYSTQRGIVQKIKNKRRRLNELYEISNNKARLIQKNIRNYLFWQKLKDLGSQYKNTNLNYMNIYSLLGEKIEDISKNFFYKYSENKIKYYAFDIRCLNKILKCGNKNPYTSKKFPKHVLLQINRIFKICENKKLNLTIPNIIPLESQMTANLASTYNKMMDLDVYPHLDRLLQLNITFLFYYTQDLMTSPLLDRHIERYWYNKILGVYNTSVRTRITESSRKIYKQTIITYLLKIINKLLDINDEFQSTRALAINEILDNNYEFFDDVEELDNVQEIISSQSSNSTQQPLPALQHPPLQARSRLPRPPLQARSHLPPPPPPLPLRPPIHRSFIQSLPPIFGPARQNIEPILPQTQLDDYDSSNTSEMDEVD